MPRCSSREPPLPVLGDVVVPTGKTLTLGAGAMLAIAGNDDRADLGSDTTRVEIIVDGTPIHHLHEDQRARWRGLNLGVVFQFFQLLPMLTLGIITGSIWANFAWGSFWSWDPKETWSLITIIVYMFVTHSRQIPGLKDIYTFNLLSLFAFSSVLMTYFGVNYFLGGMHSYAGGSSFKIPFWS